MNEFNRKEFNKEYYLKNKINIKENTKLNREKNKQFIVNSFNVLTSLLNDSNKKIDELIFDNKQIKELLNVSKYDNIIKELKEQINNLEKRISSLENSNKDKEIKQEIVKEFKFNNHINQPKGVIDNKLSKKRITIMVDKRILDIIEKTKIPFNNFFNKL